MPRKIMVALLLLSLWLPDLARAQSTPSKSPVKDGVDPVELIKAEGINRSQLMQTLTYLTEIIGPRLTNSPNFRRASVWTRDRLASWGLQNAHLEPWGPFGRGWSLRRFSAEVIEPQGIPLIAYPKAWSPGTHGELVSEVVYLDALTEADLEKYKGKLQGKIVLSGRPRKVESPFKPPATRWTDEDLLKFANDEPYPPDNPILAPPPTAEQLRAAKFNSLKLQFLTDEGAALIIEPSPVGDGGNMMVMGASVPQPFETPRAKRIRPWEVSAPRIVPQIVVAVEHYNRMVRMIEQGEKLKIAVDLAVQFYQDDLMSSHTIAEIPGTDLKDEIVMLGAHLDSWHAGTGATDNGAGVAVMMEAVRILQALKLQPRRTIRIALWGGEENAGGSRYYVAQHFARWETGSTNSAGQSAPQPKLITAPEYDKLSAYFNLDAGTGKIRGVYLAGNEALRPVLRPWLKPFRELGVSTLTGNGDWGSDFVWFEQVGLPIVSFIQDEIDYETRTHHTNQDVLERIQPDDLKQAAVVTAAFVYQTAMLDEKLPRKPLK